MESRKMVLINLFAGQEQRTDFWTLSGKKKAGRIDTLKHVPAAAAKSLQSCPTLCDPIDGSHQAPPFLGFSRQEHWSGLPFPSPAHESEK